MQTYQGNCTCGAIQFEVIGSPLFSQFCHCNRCRTSAEPSSNQEDKKGYTYTVAYLSKLFNLLSPNTELLEDSETKPNAILYSCRTCHTQIYGIAKDPKQRQAIGINGNTFQVDQNMPKTFLPIRHVYYQNRIVDIDDDLPKFTDMPEELGGSGELHKGI